ncbi:MAG: FAD-dependent oxidoreductase [Verrucomicrobiales bacterium]|nr:FAD-dependent oxidoreductase [Verrucomicrobiales bacterium]
MNKRIAVVGQGVIGLTCAAELLEQGHSVDIFSKDPFPETNSMSAGAYWWPHKAYPQRRVSEWSRESYHQYLELKNTPESGVHFEKHYRFCIDPDDCAYVLDIVDHWERIDGADYGIDCYEAFLVTLPVIDVPIFMPYLKSVVQDKGGTLTTREIDAPESLFPEYDMVINCSGVGARQFVDDSRVFPIRGQIVRASLPEGLRESTRLYRKQDEFTLILPRSGEMVLGGTSQEGDWDRAPRQSDTDEIVQRCSKLVPGVADAEILGVSVGLRPGRDEVRLEVDCNSEGQAIIHNYGHGGGGYTVAWGCAREVADLADAYFTSGTN